MTTTKDVVIATYERTRVVRPNEARKPEALLLGPVTDESLRGAIRRRPARLGGDG